MISNIYMHVRCIVGRGCVEQSGGIFALGGQALPDSHGQEQRKGSAALSATRKKPCKARG